MAAWAPATKPRGGVLVIHENRGLTPHIANVAGRWAASGWSALALDLLSEEGGTGSFPGEAEVAARARADLGQRTRSGSTTDMKAAVTELGKRVGKRQPLGATGFCFGGGMVWRLLAAREPRLAAAAPFYGPFPTGGNLKGNKADVLGIYAGADDARERHARGGPRGARGGAARLRAAHVHGREHGRRADQPRVLQRHRRAFQPDGGRGGLAARSWAGSTTPTTTVDRH